jgi:redox-sensitive bicupin YhaK (pirin superfamily)
MKTTKTYKSVIHKADSRGHFDHGWLKTFHTFSFAGYYDKSRVHFGMLRVLNDDIVSPGEGFGTHPHDNMEIVTIPLKGSLAHRDSMGHEEIITENEIQVMSAGTGITHSEYNASDKEDVSLLQIWVFPKEHDVTPRYDQRIFDPFLMKNAIFTFVSPDRKDDNLWLNQNAYFSQSDLDEGRTIEYKINSRGNGVYIFVIEGKIQVGDEMLGRRDGMGIEDTDSVDVKAESDSKILFIEIPMNP